MSKIIFDRNSNKLYLYKSYHSILPVKNAAFLSAQDFPFVHDFSMLDKNSIEGIYFLHLYPEFFNNTNFLMSFTDLAHQESSVLVDIFSALKDNPEYLKFVNKLNGNDIYVNSFEAFNNVDSTSKGHWPAGNWKVEKEDRSKSHYHSKEADAAAGEYGTYGIIRFSVKGRSGMGVHSGRSGSKDGKGRAGSEHCTMGCIRTTDAAMSIIIDTMKTSPMESIEVV